MKTLSRIFSRVLTDSGAGLVGHTLVEVHIG